MSTPPEELRMARRFILNRLPKLNDRQLKVLLAGQLYILADRCEKYAMEELAYCLEVEQQSRASFGKLPREETPPAAQEVGGPGTITSAIRLALESLAVPSSPTDVTHEMRKQGFQWGKTSRPPSHLVATELNRMAASRWGHVARLRRGVYQHSKERIA